MRITEGKNVDDMSDPVNSGQAKSSAFGLGMTSWLPDILGEGYEQRHVDLGVDPDGEGRVAAVIVRRTVRPDERVDGAVLYVHGFSDYFFQVELADRMAAQGRAFYALDLRKSGRARQAAQTAHYVSDLTHYGAELDRALNVIEAELPGLPVTVVAHSVGGLIASLWLDRRHRRGRTAPVNALVLNSPWLDLQGGALMRGPATWLVRLLSAVQPYRVLQLPATTNYGDSLHHSQWGEWEYDVDLKPHRGFPITVGWLNAVRRGHARLHRGIDVGVPALVLRSDKSHFARSRSDATDRADIVLDVDQIARWASALGARTTVVPIEDARHDVFLSLRRPRELAYAHAEAWLRLHADTGTLNG